MKENNQKRVFISPLDWGLGHATRCIPIIHELHRQNIEVIIGASGASLAILQQEFPKNAFINFPGYNIKYTNGNMAFQIFKFIPSILRSIKKEHHYLKEIIKLHHIDGVISDNRYGLYNSTVPSILITHQLYIKSPFLASFLHLLTKKKIQKFDKCWVPDFPAAENNLSGDLSHQKNDIKSVSFIGILSRFKKKKEFTPKKWDILVILSGLEPLRTNFEKMILAQLKKTDLQCLLVQGKPLESKKITQGNITIVNHLITTELEKEIRSADLIISRSGYSSIMDYVTLNKKAILIPTKGQTEQEYLASYLSKKNYFVASTEKKFNLQELINLSRKTSTFPPKESSKLLENEIKNFIKLMK